MSILHNIMNNQNNIKDVSGLNSFFRLKIGESALVVDLAIGDNQYYRQRLLAQGVVPGEILKIKHAAPFGDPIEVSLSSGRSFIIRREEANIIKIVKLDPIEK